MIQRAGVLLAAGWLAACACAPPERAACNPQPAAGELGSICGFDRPEDLELAADAGLLLASAMREGGGLHALALDELSDPDPRPWRIWPSAAQQAGGDPLGARGCDTPPDAALFYSHGLGVLALGEGVTRVAVVNHGGREAVELFDLEGSGRGAALRWRGCVPIPKGLMGNDVVLAPDGEIAVTNFVPRGSSLPIQFHLYKAALGFETGRVIAWRPERGWRDVPGTRGAGPNGLEISRDGAQLFVAENGRKRVLRLPREGGAPAAADVRHPVDNVNLADTGELVAVVHTGGVETVLQTCLLGWALWQVDPASLSAHELMRHEGETLCGATSALRIGDRYYVGSMNEDRIGVWSPASPLTRIAPATPAAPR